MPKFIEYLLDAVRRPREQLSKGQHKVRYAWEIVVYCARLLSRHRAEGMAAELTYRTIFALIPVVVLGLVLFRIVGGLEEVEANVENQLYSFFGVPEIPADYVEVDLEPEDSGDNDGAEVMAEIDPDTGTSPGPPETDTAPPDVISEDIEAQPGSPEDGSEKAVHEAVDEESRRQARASIRRTLHEVTTKIGSVDFRSIGVFGLLLFIYAAVALADSAEHLFNRIYEAPGHRPIHLRVAIHWSIITLGSGLLALSLYMSSQVIDWFSEIGAGSTLTLVLRHLLSITASWVLMFLLYALMPNTHVSVKAAASGASVSALLWEGAKFGFQTYVATAVPYSALYGSLGLIPLFLFWVYLTWLIVLFGLILSYALQTLRGRRPASVDVEQTLPHGDPDWMLPIMAEVARAFRQGRPVDRQDLAERLGLPSLIVHEFTNDLIEAGLLLRVDAGNDGDRAFTLARPADQIALRTILELAHRARPASDHPAWKRLTELKQAELKTAGDETLDTALHPHDAGQPTGV